MVGVLTSIELRSRGLCDVRVMCRRPWLIPNCGCACRDLACALWAGPRPIVLLPWPLALHAPLIGAGRRAAVPLSRARVTWLVPCAPSLRAGPPWHPGPGNRMPPCSRDQGGPTSSWS